MIYLLITFIFLFSGISSAQIVKPACMPYSIVPGCTGVSGTSPASPYGSIQFNNSGSFGGSANATLNGSGGAYFKGNLGIGQTSPSYAVDISDANSTGYDIGDSDNGSWYITNIGNIHSNITITGPHSQVYQGDADNATWGNNYGGLYWGRNTYTSGTQILSGGSFDNSIYFNQPGGIGSEYGFGTDGNVQELNMTESGAAFGIPVTGTSFNGFLANGNISQFTNDSGYTVPSGSYSWTGTDSWTNSVTTHDQLYVLNGSTSPSITISPNSSYIDGRHSFFFGVATSTNDFMNGSVSGDTCITAMGGGTFRFATGASLTGGPQVQRLFIASYGTVGIAGADSPSTESDFSVPNNEDFQENNSAMKIGFNSNGNTYYIGIMSGGNGTVGNLSIARSSLPWGTGTPLATFADNGTGDLAIGNITWDASGNFTAASYTAGSSAGVSCSAGTVTLLTETVTNGIITHC